MEEIFEFGKYKVMSHEDIEKSEALHNVFIKLPEYQQRMVEEYSELIKRYEKLKVFMTTETWYKLPSDEQQDMWYQFHAMNIYKMALRSRLDRAHIAEIFFPSPACAG